MGFTKQQNADIVKLYYQCTSPYIAETCSESNDGKYAKKYIKDTCQIVGHYVWEDGYNIWQKQHDNLGRSKTPEPENSSVVLARSLGNCTEKCQKDVLRN